MMSCRLRDRFRWIGLPAVLVTVATTAVEAQILQFDLNGELTGRVGDQTVVAELGPSAT